MKLEEKLDALADCGLKLRDQFSVHDLEESWGRDALDEPGWDLTLVSLGMTWPARIASSAASSGSSTRSSRP